MVALKQTWAKWQNALVIFKPETVIGWQQRRFKARDQELIDLVVEMKRRNPTFGYGRISMQIYEAFGIVISRFAVGRILRKNKKYIPSGGGPSWLTYIGHLKDSLWSVDMFRCESINLKSV